VLDLSKIDAGMMNLHIERFNIYDMLDDVINIVTPLVDEKILTLSIDDKSEQDVEISADRARIRQVLINIVNNAIKFTEKGQIKVLAIHQDENILISIHDTGIGIPPSKLETIFQEFAQVDNSTTRKVGGTGLGLPISRRLINMHGGRLWVESTGNPGEGSTFYVELPLEAKIVETIAE
jgi:signal transduction histidine kinase